LTERSLSGQGRALDKLSEALQSLLAEFDKTGASASQQEAIAAGRWLLARR
jgi:hypothetical protein